MLKHPHKSSRRQVPSGSASTFGAVADAITSRPLLKHTRVPTQCGRERSLQHKEQDKGRERLEGARHATLPTQLQGEREKYLLASEQGGAVRATVTVVDVPPTLSSGTLPLCLLPPFVIGRGGNGGRGSLRILFRVLRGRCNAKFAHATSWVPPPPFAEE